jgi:predicted O-methyltransferase YrrM
MSLRSLRAAAGSRLPLFRRWPIVNPLVEPSLIAPVTGAPSERLLDIAVRAIDAARSVRLDWLTARGQDPDRAPRSRSAPGRPRHHSPPSDPNRWPGQHYKLLTALVELLGPRTVVEIGTATGMSALAMKAALPRDGKIVTFDPIPWQEYSRAVLRAEDFADGRLEQRLDDLSTQSGWSGNADLLQRAEFIFVDARHDGVQERDFLRGFDEVGLAGAPIVMFDDIRLWGMLSFWQEIARPKLDLTSFGHWSGTGLVDYA